MTEVVAQLEEISTHKQLDTAFVHRLEDAALSLVLAAMVLIPLVEAMLRRTLHIGIPASTSIVQHSVLLVGMIGAVIAARESRLLALSNIEQTWLPERFRSSSHLFTSSIAAAVTAFLAFAWQWHDLRAIKTSTPVSTTLSFGLLTLKAQVEFLSVAQAAAGGFPRSVAR